jgi:flagellar protein FliO/FliZ
LFARAAAAPATLPAPAGPAVGNLLQTILALLFVLALLGGLAWLLKRFGPRASGGTANLRVVGALNLGGRERVMVIEIGDQWIVVGASPGRINALATMPRQEGVEPPAPLTAMPMAGNFADWLKQTIDKRNAK